MVVSMKKRPPFSLYGSVKEGKIMSDSNKSRPRDCRTPSKRIFASPEHTRGEIRLAKILTFPSTMYIISRYLICGKGNYMPDLTGQSLGCFHIPEQVGEGGMATVFKAYDTRMGTDMAVKVIHTENILTSTDFRTARINARNQIVSGV
jgi:hypothetical protein